MNILAELENETTATAPAGLPPAAALTQILFGKQVAFCLSAAARLGVADYMSAEPVQVGYLAERVAAHAPALYRVMRLLASADVFEEHPGQSFALTPIGELLKSDAPGSFRHLASMWSDEWSVAAYGRLAECVRTGQDGVTLAYGRNAFDLFESHPEWAENFQRAMTSYSSVTAAAILKAYDFSEIQCLADVGGGRGKLLGSILKQYPQMRGVLFDLPNVVSGAQGAGHLAEVQDRARTESGSFFERVPAHCDAYILKHIIHDWDDQRCRTILSLIREQLPPHGRVLVCEMVVPQEPGPAPAKALDIEMLVCTCGGKERTADEFTQLFASAGLRLVRILPTETPVCVIEARPA